MVFKVLLFQILWLTSSTGINFSTLIGRNTPESPHWYKVSALRYMNQETLISLGGYDGQLESDPGGMGLLWQYF